MRKSFFQKQPNSKTVRNFENLLQCHVDLGLEQSVEGTRGDDSLQWLPPRAGLETVVRTDGVDDENLKENGKVMIDSKYILMFCESTSKFGYVSRSVYLPKGREFSMFLIIAIDKKPLQTPGQHVN